MKVADLATRTPLENYVLVDGMVWISQDFKALIFAGQ